MTAMHLRTYFTGVGLVFWSLVAQGYKEETHSVLTQAAASRSVLQLNPALLEDMGLYRNSRFPNSRNSSAMTIVELLSDGAEFEDSDSRSLRHFYNPLNGQGLNIPILPTQMSSPDWALARPRTVSAQEFSYGNARQSLFDALTKATKGEREAAFGRTFQTLGQIAHHLQDMAQPQHVRNDVHCDLLVCAVIPGTGKPSKYEGWTNSNRGSLPMDPSSVGYDISSLAFTSAFNSPRRFWHTDPQDPNSPAVGIADFTNRNFVSAGTNFDRPGLFLSPVLDQNKKSPPMDIQQLCLNFNLQCPGLHGTITFFGNTVQDNFLGPGANRENPLASTYSTFDQDLINRGGTPRFSLNRFNFRAAHDFLIPRAVAYSAGMINYFFRGNIDLVPDGNTGTYLIKNLGSEAMNGTFTLYYDYDDSRVGTVNNRQLLMTWPNITIPANSQVNIGTIPVPTNPAPKNPGEYMLVFAGDMGAETAAEFGIGAVVGKIVNPPVLIFAVNRQDDAGETAMDIYLFVPEKLAQTFASNPASVSVQVGGLMLPPMQLEAPVFPCNSRFLNACPVLRVDAGNSPSGHNFSQLTLSQNNQFDVFSFDPSTGASTPLFFGNAPEDLLFISPGTLCANGIEFSTLSVGGYVAGSLVQIKLFFEGNVLFEFVMSPPPADEGPVILTNVKGVRLTDVNCRVSIQ
jgi:hypothetical protein